MAVVGQPKYSLAWACYRVSTHFMGTILVIMELEPTEAVVKVYILG